MILMGLLRDLGKPDFAQIIRDLKKIGYQRYLSVEVLKRQAGIQETATRSYNYISPLLAEL